MNGITTPAHCAKMGSIMSHASLINGKYEKTGRLDMLKRGRRIESGAAELNV